MTNEIKELPVCECDMCGQKFRQARNDQRFCSNKCLRTFYANVQKRASAVYRMLYAHRKSHGKAHTMTDIWKVVDQHIREDAAGRAK